MMETYRTKEIARLIGVHPNTVRLYEELGFITPPERLENGYRVFTALQLGQLRLARLALRGEVLQNGLRKKAVEIIRLCAALDFVTAVKASQDYETMLVQEIWQTKAAAASVEAALNGKRESDGIFLKRREAAERLNVTMDTLRNWEHNGLIAVKRSQNGYRVYNGEDLERLNIIRTLRTANYSLAAILRLTKRLEDDAPVSVAAILNTPAVDEDIVSVCDRLILSLENTRSDAKHMQTLLKSIESDFKTLH